MSHIVPEFCYKPCYDGAGRMRALDMRDPDRAWKMQKGIRELLLCRVCEQHLNDRYEKPFKAYWFDQRPLDGVGHLEGGVIQVPDYSTFKLFHLSVLLRSDLASGNRWSEVDVGRKHRARLLEMVRDGDPGRLTEYPIACFPVKGHQGEESHFWDFVGPPGPGRLGDVRYYEFTFGGCAWFYFVASHTSQDLAKVHLQADGSLPFLRGDWPGLNRYRS